jgi:hypothetical protein
VLHLGRDERPRHDAQKLLTVEEGNRVGLGEQRRHVLSPAADGFQAVRAISWQVPVSCDKRITESRNLVWMFSQQLRLTGIIAVKHVDHEAIKPLTIRR